MRPLTVEIGILRRRAASEKPFASTTLAKIASEFRSATSTVRAPHYPGYGNIIPGFNGYCFAATSNKLVTTSAKRPVQKVTGNTGAWRIAECGRVSFKVREWLTT